MKLYEVVELYNENEQEKTDRELYNDTKELIISELESKSSNMIKLIRDKESDIETILNEIKRLQELKKYKEKQNENLKKYIKWAMQETNQKKVETPLGIFSLRKSEKLNIVDEKNIPAKYIKIKQTETVDKISIKKDIKKGEIVSGAEIEINQNLQIK